MPNADEVVNDIMYRYGWIKEPALKKRYRKKKIYSTRICRT